MFTKNKANNCVRIFLALHRTSSPTKSRYSKSLLLVYVVCISLKNDRPKHLPNLPDHSLSPRGFSNHIFNHFTK